MIPEIGQFALILALMLALAQATLPLIGAAKGIPQLVAMARPTAQAQFIFVLIAISCLGYSFITNDFSVLNVATNSNSQLPLQYRLAATWGSHEGSLLLWTFMLTVSGSARRSRFESVAARPGDGRASADAIHGLRRILRCVCICDFSSNQR